MITVRTLSRAEFLARKRELEERDGVIVPPELRELVRRTLRVMKMKAGMKNKMAAVNAKRSKKK